MGIVQAHGQEAASAVEDDGQVSRTAGVTLVTDGLVEQPWMALAERPLCRTERARVAMAWSRPRSFSIEAPSIDSAEVRRMRQAPEFISSMRPASSRTMIPSTTASRML